MAKETAQKTARKPKPRLIEMSDGTLRVRSGWAYAYILPGCSCCSFSPFILW